jgi:APA family basic amino acid/polyamine antiporter
LRSVAHIASSEPNFEESPRIQAKRAALARLTTGKVTRVSSVSKDKTRTSRGEDKMAEGSSGGGGLFRVKPLERLVADHAGADGSGVAMVRTLGWPNLMLMGVGVVIGAGIFVITGTAAAQYAGPAIVFSFILAGLGCALAGLCYAELAAMMPVSGSGYTYAYATLGELVAWIVGFNLLIEYFFAGSFVSVGWSAYANNLLGIWHLQLPKEWITAPFTSAGGKFALTGGIVNLPAMAIALACTAVARGGIGVSAGVNAVIVSVKVVVLILFMMFGFSHVRPENWTPFIPANTGVFGEFGISGILRGAAVVFISYLGFDAVATAAQETKNPQKNLPIGILGSLALCTALYIGVSLVLTGLAHYTTLNVANPLSKALEAAGGSLDWLVPVVDVAAVVGLASTVLVIMLAQPRVQMAMSRDGLLPAALGRLHPKHKTPSFATTITGVAVAICAGVMPIEMLGQLVSLGALSVFIVVCVGVLILRWRRPEAERPFRVPFAPVTPVLGAAICVYLLTGLPPQAWGVYAVWLALGLVIYFTYGRKNATRLFERS